METEGEEPQVVPDSAGERKVKIPMFPTEKVNPFEAATESGMKTLTRHYLYPVWIPPHIRIVFLISLGGALLLSARGEAGFGFTGIFISLANALSLVFICNAVIISLYVRLLRQQQISQLQKEQLNLANVALYFAKAITWEQLLRRMDMDAMQAQAYIAGLYEPNPAKAEEMH